jgi:hypothetical protein
MPEITSAGPAGRIGGRYHPARQKNAPMRSSCTRTLVWRDDEPPIIYGSLRLCAPGVSALRFASVVLDAAKARSTTVRRTVRCGRRQLGADYQPRAKSCWIAGFPSAPDRHATIDATAGDRRLYSICPPQTFLTSLRRPALRRADHSRRQDAVVLTGTPQRSPSRKRPKRNRGKHSKAPNF